MSDYKRFTERVDSGFVSELDCRIAYNKLCAIEDKIESGTIIVPKFKIGEVVFFVVRNTIHTSIITDIKIHIFRSNHCKIQYRLTSPDGYMNYKNENDLSLTKAEAEKKLKELKEGGE